MSLDYSKTYIQDKDFEVTQREDKFLYVDYENVNWFRTNDTGNEIISMCNGIDSLEQVVAKIADKYKFNAEFLKKQFEPYISDAIDKNIILEVGKEKEALGELKFSQVPGDIWIHVSGICNLECPFCYSRSGYSENRELDLESLLSFLEGLEEEKRSRVVISGGEPFLFKKLPELVMSLREMKFKDIAVISNGTIGAEMYDKVLPHIKTLQISVDGTVPEYHDLTRGKGSFEKMISKFKLAKAAGANSLVISFTPTKFNIEDLPNIPQFALDHGIDSLHITRLMPVGRGKANMEDIEPDEETYADCMKRFVENYQKVINLIHIKRETEQAMLEEKDKTKYISLTFAGDQTFKIAYRSKRPGCGAGLGSMSINYDGNIYPCASLHNNDYVFGNIRENSIDEVIDNAMKFMKKHCVDNIPGCSDCKLKYFCGGGCRACALGCNEDILGKDTMCDRYKTAMVEIMLNYEIQNKYTV